MLLAARTRNGSIASVGDHVVADRRLKWQEVDNSSISTKAMNHSNSFVLILLALIENTSGLHQSANGTSNAHCIVDIL